MQNTILSINKILEENTSYAAYRKHIKNQFPLVDDQLSKSEFSYAEALYLFVHELSARPSCKHCGKELKYIDRSAGYGEYCSHKCYVLEGCGVERRKETNLEKYGCENSLGNIEIRERRRRTMIEKYGTEFPLQNEILKKKSVETFKQGYTEEYQNKKKKTCLEKYGVEHPTQSKEVMENIRTNNLKKYGVEWVQQDTNIKNKGILTRRRSFYKEIEKRCPNVKPLFTESEFINVNTSYKWKCLKCNSEFIDHIDDGSLPICKICYPVTTGSSLGEKELVDYIKNTLGLEIIENTKDIISPKEIDIFIPSLNVGIEYNGLYWHSEKKVNKTYHQDKFLLCKEKGIKLIQIFEDEWIYKQEIVKQRLAHILQKSKKICYARQCIIKEVNSADYKAFIEKYHLQGYVPSSKIIGAHFSGQLVAVMSFGVGRSISKNKEIELLRFATIGNIPGIAGKLFSNFVKTENPSSVFSYCDLRWGNGTVYSQIGMKFNKITIPGYCYSRDGITRQHRYNFTKYKLVKEGYEKSLTETEIMNSRGYYKIYDAGNYKFIWSNPLIQ